ncbi:MAG: SurA N-terminal domain-containing protein, partial [Nanoarchaeota archaeon]
MKKKTPKRSSRKNSKQKEKRDRIIIIGIFIAFIAILAFLFYFTEIGANDDAVAVVNGKEITKSELDWWYHTSILPEHREIISKEDFLALSLIPQKVLVQEAGKNGIKVSKEEIEKSLGLFIIGNGWNLEEFEAHLASRGITLEQIKESFEIRLLIIKLLEKENLDVADKDRLFFDGSDIAIQDYVTELMDKSEIEIFSENIEPLILTMFEETKDELCSEDARTTSGARTQFGISQGDTPSVGKPIVRLYTTSKCATCENTGKIFENVVMGFVSEGSIEAKHWSLDTGDNLLSEEKEEGIPKEEVELFKKYGKGKVPA